MLCEVIKRATEESMFCKKSGIKLASLSGSGFKLYNHVNQKAAAEMLRLF